MRTVLLILLIMLLCRCQGYASVFRSSELRTLALLKSRNTAALLKRSSSSLTNADLSSCTAPNKFANTPIQTTQAISSVLSNHLLRQLVMSLEGSKLEAPNSEIYEEYAQKLHKIILSHPRANTSNSALSSFGLGLCKVLPRLLPAEITKVCQDEENLEFLLERWQKSNDASAAIFDAITSHHRAIVKEEWTDVAADQTSLAKYSEAASAMGAKKWVMDCNEWMETFAVGFFKHGTARKHYVKEYQIKHNLAKNDSVLKELLHGLPKDLTTVDSPFGSRIKLLDVGSCYNPIGRSNNSTSLDVTALDLYPADPSVYQADFLNLAIGTKDSQPQIEVTPSATAHSEASSVLGRDLQRLVSLPEGSFDVVTMSLVLNYLPSPEQRLQMIRKARQLLRSPSSLSTTDPNTNNVTGESNTPHRTGLLLIAEKESIFSSSEHAIESVGQNKKALLSGWKQAIAKEGFSLVKYQLLKSGPKRYSHVFAFATTNPTDAAEEDRKIVSEEAKVEGKEQPKLWIRQDFDVFPDATASSTENDGEEDLQQRLKQYRASIAGRRPIGIVGGGIGGSALGMCGKILFFLKSIVIL